MKLRTFIDQLDDGLWIRVFDKDRVQHDFLCADYIGWYDPVMEEIKPFLNKQIDDRVWVEVRKDPETPRRRVPIVCIQLM